MVLRFLAWRLVAALPVLFGISVFTFLLIHLIPGDLVTVLVGLNLGAAPDAADQIRAALHLDDPLHIQYLKWLWSALHGDLGNSLILGFPVGTQIVQHLPITLELAMLAIMFSLLFGIPLGIIAARARNRWPDVTVTALSLLGLSTPEFFLGTIIILLGALYAPGLRTFGYVPFTQDPLGNLQSMVFPAVTLGFALSTIVMRYTRSSILEVLREQYITTARERASNRVVLYRHPAQRSLPVVTVASERCAWWGTV